VPTSQDPSARPSNKKFSTTDTWSAELICDWLNSGYSNWLNPPDDEARANAFFPLKFIDDEDASRQIEKAAKKKSWLSPNLPQGLDLALEGWRPFRGLNMLAELFDLAACVGTPRLKWHSMRLVRSAMVSEAPTDARREVVSAMTSAIANTPWDESSEAFIRELRLKELWDPSLEARVMLARTRADADNWLSLAATALPGIIANTKAKPKLRKLYMARLVDTVSMKRIVTGLANAPSVEECLALILILFFDNEPVLALSYKTEHEPNRKPEPKGVKFRSQEHASPDPDTDDGYAFWKLICKVRDAGAILEAVVADRDRKGLALHLALQSVGHRLHPAPASPSVAIADGRPRIQLAAVNGVVKSQWGGK
jgi:hypothetical protein